ncbi:cell filamentation protein [Pontibacter mucosus]|uniref:protein adenylyltransferase n=1 Tax=Pontibacter mucosus TaxID=1649266 RepID=A0A2T5Y9S9_9BACT|nr:Fic family protein [Pontibacter mucosus]PTX13138.1 cell filamentation protein [Pontibacter mucosus]
MNDRYCYPGTSVLINHFDIRDAAKLSKLELTHWRHNVLALPGKFASQLKFDLALWQLIHKETFGTVYPWAGELRSVMISKGNAVHAAPRMIEPYANHLLQELKAAGYLKGLDREQFLLKGSYFFEELNAIHPFREGNTRTLKVFFSLLSQQAGYEIDWRKVSAQQYQQAEQASFAAGNKGPSPFYPLFKEALEPVELSNKQSIRFKL